MVDVELIRLKARAIDSGHLKLATWGTRKQLISVLTGNCADPYQDECVNKFRMENMTLKIE